MIRKRQSLGALVLTLSIGGLSSIALADPINPGFDLIRTPPGGAVFDFSLVDPSFPEGIADMQGEPVFGMVDTIIERTSGLPSGGTGVINAQIHTLSLRTVDPLINPTFFPTGDPHHAFVVRNPALPSPGSLTITSHDDSADPPGGDFDSSFDVNAVLRFRNESTMTFLPDIPLPTDVITSTGATWQHTPPDDYPMTPAFPGGNFFIGPTTHTGPHPETLPGCIDCGPGPTIPVPDHHTLDLPLTDSFGIGPTTWSGVPSPIGDLTIRIRPTWPPPWHRPFPPLKIIRDPEPPFDVLYQFDSEFVGQLEVLDESGQVIAEAELLAQGLTETLVQGFNNPQRQTGTFETEILSMDLVGEIPGIGKVQIRENPELNSRGRQSITEVFSPQQPNGETEFHVDSFFDVFTEISINGGEFVPSDAASRVVLDPVRPGDTNKDDRISIADIQQSIANFTGPTNDGTPSQDTISGLNRTHGDVQGDVGDPNLGDGDVDVADIQVQIANFDIQQAGEALGVVGGGLGDPSTADLVYNFVTGEVWLDPTDSPGGELTSFRLEDSTLNAPGTAMFPGHGLTTDTPSEISWTDPFLGETTPIDLGAIFPTGLMTVAALDGYLSVANYTGSLGSGGPFDFELHVIPEPTSLLLVTVASLLSLSLFRIRRVR